jgi:hypothetical protein
MFGKKKNDDEHHPVERHAQDRCCCWVDRSDDNNSKSRKREIEDLSVTSVTSHVEEEDTCSSSSVAERNEDDPRCSERAILHRRPLLEKASELVLGVCQLLLSMWMMNQAAATATAIFQTARLKRKKRRRDGCGVER